MAAGDGVYCVNTRWRREQRGDRAVLGVYGEDSGERVFECGGWWVGGEVRILREAC